MEQRRIVHIDMDAFYASVEQRDDPALRGRPLAVGRGEARGVVAAASYEARRFGVRSAMPSVTAKRLCPELVFVPARFDVYRAVSAQIHDIFSRYTPLIQPLSLDEATLDLTDHLGAYGSATLIADRIRADIHAETGLTASAGVSYNRFLAKLASDCRKPNGLFVITPAMGPNFVSALPVDAFHGIGPATARKMRALGIETGADLRRQDLATLTRHFGKSAVFYHGISRGIDHRPVVVNRERKSLGTEQTYLQDLTSSSDADQALMQIASRLWGNAQRRQLQARTVTLKVKYADFRQITRARTLPAPVPSEQALLETGQGLMMPLLPFVPGVRLLGLTLSGFHDTGATPHSQMELLL
ncbi:DNA polymerase IV [Gluconobacter kanchanaburiensis]|uniref:DNA polymerase IV n=1 Tax=Gluconobacter kanchanaburiensis NBRC 103587 TaxID=1307948 RepID=A0A511B7Z6_9PROT|nr:DNA polymerase IV [Gluconobacter kanchanaburiensis]MBF0862193.1 DNA polymerase IV [Gluconobacter kanchanaburiensis]GBR71368.1 DNA polymerase IV [Gluconobacter kanchanaburiensis NBRC 103587]GEK96539.1 DNA polymerase IV [Gluconobacter kanchanaburiensis NBRC 103587]